ncbi:MAG: patatin-like phospholipase family protein [Spirochaetota bacterium]
MATKLGKIGIALGGGAARGLAHIGALRALEEAGMAPSFITGTSAGALVGGLYAAGVPVSELERIAREMDESESSKLIDLTWARGSLVAGRSVEEFLRTIVGDVLIENLPKPFMATAVDINTGAGFLFDGGRLVDAIRASISIPGIFEPVSANGRYLVDGGVRLNLPLRVLNRWRPDTIVGVGLTRAPWRDDSWNQTEIDRKRPPGQDDESNIWERLKDRFGGGADRVEEDGKDLPGLRFLLARTFVILTSQMEQQEVDRAKPDLYVDLDVHDIALWEFWRGEEAMQMGYEQTRDAISEFLRREEGPRGAWRRFIRRLRRRA